MPNFQAQTLLDKASSDDADLRFMALTDLVTEASHPGFAVDESTETKVTEMVLRLMEDTNGEVKNAGVKALSALAPRLRKPQLSKVIDRLIILSSGGNGKEESLRDVASLALKTVTSQIGPESTIAQTVVEKLPPKLLAQLDAASLPPQQTLETLDILSDLFIRFQSLILTQPEIQKESLRVLVGLLSTGRLAVKKKAIVALGSLITSSVPKIFTSLSKTLISTLSDANTSPEVSRAYIMLVGTLSRSAPQKTGLVIKEVMPSILEICRDEEDEEGREVGLATLESLILKCPTEITPFITSILAVAVELVAYDPNYAGDDEDDEDMDDGEEDEDEDEDLEEEYDDEEDATWKVRRSAAKVLSAIVSTRSELLLDFFRTVSPVLISRISEREESVRLEVFATLSLLLRQTLVFGKTASADEEEDYGRMTPGTLKRKREADEEEARKGGKRDAIMDDAEDTTPLSLLQSQVPALLKQVLKQLGTKSLPTKQAGFVLLRELVAVLRGGLDSQAVVVCTRVTDTLSTSGSSNTAPLTAETLSFLGQFFATHSVPVYQAYLPKFVPQIVRLTQDKSQRTSIEAFVVASELAKSLRQSLHLPLAAGLAPFVEEIYKAATDVLEGNLADVDVRIKALDTLADLLSFEGDVLESQYPTCLEILSTSLGNETLRLPALRSITRVAESSLCQGEVFGAWLLESLQTVAGVLKRGSRSVKSAAFDCLEAILSRLGSAVPESVASELILELQPFIVDTDLHNLPLALDVLVLLLKVQPGAKATIESEILPKVYTVTRSPLLTGIPLEAVLSFFGGLVAPDPDLALNVIPELIKFVSKQQAIPDATSGDTQSYKTVSKCVGVIVAASQRNSAGVIAEFSKHIQKSTKSSPPTVFLALLSLGEVGRNIDMSNHADIFARIIELFTDPSEDVKGAAAFAAGNFAVGAPKYLQPIVKQVETAADRETKLLSLHALKEAVFHCSRSQLESVADTLWKPLFEDSETQAEETRHVVASCIGKLTTSNPAKYLPLLQSRLQSPSADVRATVASAVRYTFTDTAASYDDILAPVIVEFLSLMHDEDLTVRRLSLGSLNAAAQHKPQLIREHLGTLLPLLYVETEIKKELLRTVQMGPWKQVFDDGLETRKTAYETMYTLLDTCLSKIDIPTYLARVVAGLEDADEIKVICFLSLARLSQLAPAPVTQILDDVSESFKETMKAFVGGKDTVKQDFDRKAELQRSALRTIFQLSKLSSTATTPKWEEVVVSVKRGEFAREWSELERAL